MSNEAQIFIGLVLVVAAWAAVAYKERAAIKSFIEEWWKKK